MRQAARRDDNETEIVTALESVGCTVYRLSQAGIPDLLVGYIDPFTNEPHTTLIEVKESKGTLTVAQMEWHAYWNGEVHIVRSVEEALKAVGR